MTASDSEPDAERDAGERHAPRTPAQRLAALLALIALLTAAAVSSWWILTDRADFGAAGRGRAPEAPGEPRR